MRIAHVALGLILAMPVGSPGQEDVVSVGVALPLSGPTANFGTEALRGMNLAVESVNAAGGVRNHTLQLTVQDNAADPATTSRIVSEMTSGETANDGTSRLLSKARR